MRGAGETVWRANDGGCSLRVGEIRHVRHKVLDPPRLGPRGLANFHESREPGVVPQALDWNAVVDELVPIVYRIHHPFHLELPRVVVMFSIRKRARAKRNGLKAFPVVLHESGPDAKVRVIVSDDVG